MMAAPDSPEQQNRFQPADLDFTTLPDPIAVAKTLAEHPVFGECPPTVDVDDGGAD